MDVENAVDALGALANPHRLAAYRLLVQQGADGLPAGMIAERLGMAPSSLTFHLRHLQRAGLVSQRRTGRLLIYAADYAAMNALLGYLTENCCGDPELCASRAEQGQAPAGEPHPDDPRCCR